MRRLNARWTTLGLLLEGKEEIILLLTVDFFQVRDDRWTTKTARGEEGCNGSANQSFPSGFHVGRKPEEAYALTARFVFSLRGR